MNEVVSSLTRKSLHRRLQEAAQQQGLTFSTRITDRLIYVVAGRDMTPDEAQEHLRVVWP